MFNDLSQVADIVNRKKISDRRLRNEAMRQGTSDAGAFSQQNQAQIQEAQQPTEFWGAGRKEAKNQAPDVAAANFVGGIHNLGGIYNYYGDQDTSTAQFGTKGYKTQSKGDGTYDIFGKNDNIIGQGYSDPYSAAQSKHQQNILNSIVQRTDTDEFGNKNSYYTSKYYQPQSGYDGIVASPNWQPATVDEWGTKESMEDSLKRFQSHLLSSNPITPRSDAGLLGDWETLGQVLRGTPLSGGKVTGRRLPANNQTEAISGLETLYGSTPLLWDGALKGYSMDLGVATPGTSGYKNPFQVARIDDKGNTKSNYQLTRDIQSPEKWNSLGKMYGDNKFFVTPENAPNLPGWLNRDVSQYSHQSSGAFGKIAAPLGAIMSFIPGLQPFGMALSAAGSLANNNPLGALTSVIGGMGGFNKLAGGLSELTSFSPSIAKALVTGGFGGLTSVAQGGNFLGGALGAGLGSYAGGALGDLFKDQGPMISKALGGAASGGLNSLFTKGDAVRGSLFGGMSGGLHGFLNSTDISNNKFNAEANNRNKQSAKDITSLAKLFVKRR